MFAGRCAYFTSSVPQSIIRLWVEQKGETGTIQKAELMFSASSADPQTVLLHENLQEVYSAQFIPQTCEKRKWLSLGSYLLPPKNFKIPCGVLRGTKSYYRSNKEQKTKETQEKKKRHRITSTGYPDPPKKVQRIFIHDDNSEELVTVEDEVIVEEYTTERPEILDSDIEIETSRLVDDKDELNSSDDESVQSLNLRIDDDDDSQDSDKSPEHLIQSEIRMKKSGRTRSPGDSNPELVDVVGEPQRHVVYQSLATGPKVQSGEDELEEEIEGEAESEREMESERETSSVIIRGICPDGQPIIANANLLDPEFGFMEFDLENEYDVATIDQ